MGPLLVLLGIGLVVIGAPILLFREYRRELVASRVDRPALPPADGILEALVRSGEAAGDHRLALGAGIIRGLVPAWAIGLGLILLGVFLSGPA
jgi:hypothetical protein